MKNWLNISSKISAPEVPKGTEETSHNYSQYPVALLSKYIGSMIAVYYVDVGVPQIIRAQLCAKPNNECFYLSFGGADMYINYWYKVHADGRISAVKLIKHQDEVLYEAQRVHFNDLGPACCMEKESVGGPVRMLTREYLHGVFG
jgi:hypothetical protein